MSKPPTAEERELAARLITQMRWRIERGLQLSALRPNEVAALAAVAEWALALIEASPTTDQLTCAGSAVAELIASRRLSVAQEDACATVILWAQKAIAGPREADGELSS